MADGIQCPLLPADRAQLEELRGWNSEMLEVWRSRKDSYIRNYVMLCRWGQNPDNPKFGNWMLKLTYSPMPGEPDTRLSDPRLVFTLVHPVSEFLPPNVLWHCTERLRRIREEAINHNFDPSRLAVDVETAIYELFQLSESLEDRLLAALTISEPAKLASQARQPHALFWYQAREKMLEMMNRGERFTSQPDMAQQIGCSSATINKAIKRTPDLKQWAAKQRSSSTGMKSLDGIVVENIPDEREPNPGDLLEHGDIDRAMQYLMEQAGPEEQANIEAMDDAKRRQLAETAYRDPDASEQILRWRKRKPLKN